MDSLYILIPIALVFFGVAIKLLFWAINSGQYDNLDTEAHRILFDEDPPAEQESAEADEAPENTGDKPDA